MVAIVLTQRHIGNAESAPGGTIQEVLEGLNPGQETTCDS